MNQNLFAPYTDKETFAKIRRYETMADMWENVSAEYADAVAIEDNGNSYTYKTLADDVARMRGVLLAAGVEKGARVGMYIPSSYDFVKTYLAITTLGAVAVLLPVQLDDKTVYGCTMKFRMPFIVADASLSEKTALASKMGVKILDSGCDLSAAAAAPAARMTKEDECSILFTGGTTGRSKGALLTHLAMMTGIRNGCYGIKDVFGQRYLLVLPLTHVFGLIRNLLTALQTGSSVYICRNPKDMFKVMGVYRPTVLILVPALAELALNISKQFGAGMLGGNLKTIIAGACMVPPFLVHEYAEMGVTLLAGYGLTESANLVSGNPESHKKPSSVGIPYPDQELKVVNGELWLRGDNMLTRYEGDPEETAAAFEDGWFKTGDLVRFDEDGYLYIVGRSKEVIVLPTGENISPADLEAKFCQLDGISDAMVFEETEGGRSFLALEVVPRATCRKTAEELTEGLNAINAALPAFQRVSKITVRDKDFDRTPAMKKIRKKNV